MRTIIKSIFILATFATVLLGKAAAQVPTSYQCVILNDTMVSSTVYEFDVYVKNTSSNTTKNNGFFESSCSSEEMDILSI